MKEKFKISIKRVDLDLISYEHDITVMQNDCLPGIYGYLDDSLHGYWWIAFDGEIPVGYLGLVHTSGFWYLCNCGVIKNYRGHGIMKRMIYVMLKHARNIGIKTIYTDTNENPASANSLIHCGFRMFLPKKIWAYQHSQYWKYRLQ